jgi:hypothetical protein
VSYAAETSTSVEKTRAELETTLSRFGAEAFGYMTDAGRAAITFRASGKCVRFILPLPLPTDERFTRYKSRGYSYDRAPAAARKEWEQACRSAWRALFLCVKAKLIAVDAKITTFEDEFMAHIVLPNGRTVSEEITPLIEGACATGKMPVFTLALPERSQA